MTHSMFAPSAADRWVPCPASVRLILALGSTALTGDSEASREGRAAHWVFAQTLRGLAVGGTDPDGYEIDSEMVRHAGEAAQWVFEQSKGAELHIEEPMPIPYVAPGCYGTPDVWWYSIEGNVVEVPDFKYGWRIVEPTCHQLGAYASGVMAKLGFDGIRDQNTGLRLHILQPRPYHRNGPYRTWSGKCSDIRGMVNIMAAKAEEAKSEKPTYATGSHCLFCPARHICPTFGGLVQTVKEMAEGPMIPPMAPLPQQGRELTLLRSAKEVLDARITGLEASIEANLRAGERVPGWELARVVGRLKWAAPTEQIRGIEAAMGVKLFTDPEPITPTQAKVALKHLGKDVVTSILGPMTLRSEGLALQPVDMAAIQKAFKNGK